MTTPLEDELQQPDEPGNASAATTDPPRNIRNLVRYVGPGLIMAAAIVGSGELIATTKTGAQGGMTLLWFIVVGCVIKVFVQVELGRYAISEGRTTLEALNTVPGPRLRVNWILWVWVVMMICTIGQLGGIVGGVGQSLAMTFPITGDYIHAVSLPEEGELRRYVELRDKNPDDPLVEAIRRRIDRAGAAGWEALENLEAGRPIDPEGGDPYTWDDRIWAGVAAAITSVFLFFGRYNLIQNFSITLVGLFTFLTIGNVISLQFTQEFSLTSDEVLRGLQFRLADEDGGWAAWVFAISAFGLIGVGATELISYPYWCLERGYARYCGPRDDTSDWEKRARGWMRVMRFDAFGSMVCYTIATVCFFLMGVAVLHRRGLDPSGMRMVSTLGEAYVPVFGSYAKWLFLTGAISVLYSTFLVANASNARMFADGAIQLRLIPKSDVTSGSNKTVIGLSALLPLLCFALYLVGLDPVLLIAIGGLTQTIMLGALAAAALYFRFVAIDRRLRPTRAWDLFLILSAGSLVAFSICAFGIAAAQFI
ncbi:Nramp family divalent metal transporter [Stratiformator vulcanicus]|uniref:Manganese transport protein MntH n=1 Tax=Stratiformator vulcanicus TaxID=2527980 RepID=A0A517R5V9_9PLAN|nr:Nramp family divalent metal transporter [Stratiformator vulcanicus]QDT39252.1 manganese transport protein MntH [Stratiformator vulcanicus]